MNERFNRISKEDRRKYRVERAEKYLKSHETSGDKENTEEYEIINDLLRELYN